ncbi:hypothetical protein PUV54_12460 [Hyphococcus flavus]|uniref:Uncharacterized protein n=1 Tax=Hyphococcus flavus TaxID=1866326 RepID=A0AAE9ZI84_9PROT|nr:hypothetical protein [Hyphococcus flavus]WDI30765.1 hypothetical protein PUV54_12460 [Hyphococcus flavus]
MNPYSVCHQIVVVVSVLAVAACAETRDPASEAPVDPQAGQYKITLSGKGLLKHAGGDDDPETFCLTELNRDAFAHMLAENYYKLHPSCRVVRAPREGNAISGEIKCPVDPKMATGSNSFIYEGAVAPDSAKVEVRIKFDAKLKNGTAGEEVSNAQLKFAMKTYETMRFVIEATRMGECS